MEYAGVALIGGGKQIGKIVGRLGSRFLLFLARAVPQANRIALLAKALPVAKSSQCGPLLDCFPWYELKRSSGSLQALESSLVATRMRYFLNVF
jgi:hypothetical protein